MLIRHLPEGLKLQELLDWIENLPEDEASHNQNIHAFNDAVNDIIAYGSSSIEPLTERLMTSNNSWMQWAGIWTFRKLNEKRTSDVLLLVFHRAKNHLGIQGSALIALSMFKDERIYDISLSLLDHPILNMRTTAIAALGNLGNPNAITVLIALLNDTHENIRIFTATALGNIKDVRGVEPLIIQLSKATLHEKEFIIAALAKIKHSSATPALKTVINAEDVKSTTSSQYDRLRCDAVDAIACIDHPDTIPTLQAFLNHPKQGVRRHARKALSKLLPES